MKQVWPRPDGYTAPVAVCQSRSDRLSFSHPQAFVAMVPECLFGGLGALLVGSDDRGVMITGVVVLAAAVAGLLLSLCGVVAWLREDRIAHTGTDVRADVTEVKRGWSQQKFSRPYKVRYRYADSAGVEHAGRVRVIGDSWDNFNGQQVLVRYDPQHPARSAMVWNSLTDSINASLNDRNGQDYQ